MIKELESLCSRHELEEINVYFYGNKISGYFFIVQRGRERKIRRVEENDESFMGKRA